MIDDDQNGQRRKGPGTKRVPTELLFLGWLGFTLLVIGALLASEAGDMLANAGLLMTIGAAAVFFLRMLLARGQRG